MAPSLDNHQVQDFRHLGDRLTSIERLHRSSDFVGLVAGHVGDDLTDHPVSGLAQRLGL